MFKMHILQDVEKAYFFILPEVEIRFILGSERKLKISHL